MTFDLSTYLARIELPAAACPPTLAGLARLQHAQMSAIPFENLDPYLGAVPDLAPEAVWQKLVVARRGGYCFELNQLFGRALTELGFQVRPVLGRVRMGAPVASTRAHLAWIATVDGADYLVDTGFGGPGAIAPLAP